MTTKKLPLYKNRLVPVLLVLISLINAADCQATPVSNSVNISNWWIPQSMLSNPQIARDAGRTLVDMSRDISSVMLVGSGQAIDMMKRAFTKRLGPKNVYSMPAPKNNQDIAKRALNLKPDRIIGVKNESIKHIFPGQRTVTFRDQAKRLAGKIGLALKGLEHIDAISDTSMYTKRQLYYLRGLSKTNLFKFTKREKALKKWGLKEVKALESYYSAFEKDRSKWSKGNFTLLRSDVMEKLGKTFVIDKGAEKLAMHLAQRVGSPMLKEVMVKGVKKNTIATMGLDDLGHAGFRIARDRRVDIESVELILDGIVGATWWALGNMQGGAVTGKAYQVVAVETAKVLRANTQGLADNAYRLWTGDRHRKQIETQEREMAATSKYYGYAPPPKIDSSKQNRRVIFGFGPEAQKKYDKAVQAVGRQNVKWVHSTPSRSQRRHIAERFGANTTSVVRSTSYREITRQGITKRIPINSSPSTNSLSSARTQGGATTDKDQVTWDDNEWPFLPIYGLLYFAP